MVRAVDAMIFGVRAVARAPIIVLWTYIALVTAVVPASTALMNTLASAIDDRRLDPPLPLRADDAWIARANDVGGSVTGGSLSAAIVGFGMFPSNLADLVDARQQSATLTATVAVWLAIWTLLLGGVLHRFAQGHALGAVAFARSCVRRVVPFTAIALATLCVYAAAALLSRAAFAGQLTVLAAQAIVVGTVSVIASYTRARIVTRNAGLGSAVAATIRMIRATPSTYAAHMTLGLAAWACLLAGFAAADWYFGRGGGPWRAVILAQIYILGRVALRLIWEASTLKLVGRISEAELQASERGGIGD